MAVLALVYSFFDSVAMPIAMKTKKKMSIKEMWQFPVLCDGGVLFLFEGICSVDLCIICSGKGIDGNESARHFNV